MLKNKTAYLSYAIFAASFIALTLNRENIAIAFLVLSAMVFFLGGLLKTINKKQGRLR